MSNLAGSSLNLVSDTGGSVRVTIAANAGQGNGGTSLQCKEVVLVAGSGNSGNMRVTIGAACTSTTGIPVPKFGTNHYVLRFSIDDVAKLYFYSDDAADDVVDILYRA
jgi:hypothetical protein